MKKEWKVSNRDRHGVWHDMGIIEAASNIMARNIAFNKVSGLGQPGVCDTHRVQKGKTVYEYSNGALCVEAQHTLYIHIEGGLVSEVVTDIVGLAVVIVDSDIINESDDGDAEKMHSARLEQMNHDKLSHGYKDIY